MWLATSACSIQWQDERGHLHDAGFVICSRQALDHGEVRTVYSPGLSLRFSGPGAGVSLGWRVAQEYAPELHEPVLSGAQALRAFLDEMEAFPSGAPASSANTPATWTMLLTRSPARTGDLAALHTLAVGVEIARAPGGVALSVGVATLIQPVGAALHNDVVLMYREDSGSPPHAALIMWRPRWPASARPTKIASASDPQGESPCSVN